MSASGRRIVSSLLAVLVLSSVFYVIWPNGTAYANQITV